MRSKKSVLKCRSKYVFGYDGQEKVNEWAGIGNHNTAKFWEYDTRTAQRLNLDPVINHSLSPYATFDLTPIWKSDVLGNNPDVIFEGTDGRKVTVKAPGEDHTIKVPVALKQDRTINLNGASKHFAYGYTISGDLNLGAGTTGAYGGAEVSVVNFSDPKYAGYNYVYAGTHSGASFGGDAGASGSVGFSLFVAFNTDPFNQKHLVKSFAGPFYNASFSGDLKDVAGGGFTFSGFSSTKNPFEKGWKGLSIGVNLGIGEDANLSLSLGGSNTTLLNDVKPTAQRSFWDKAVNRIIPVKSSFVEYAAHKLSQDANK